MYNRLYDYFAVSNILFNKQFGFWAGDSTEHVLLELIDQICDSFNDKNYFLGIFIDLFKVFDTVDHSLLLKKLENYEINFIIYVNDLRQKSEFLKLITFTDDTNLFCESKTAKTLFLKLNIKLEKTSEWFQVL